MKLIVKGPKDDLELDLQPGTTIFGRSRNSDVVLQSDSISRRHFSATVRDDGLLIKDLESRNGIWVDRKRTEEVLIHDGDTFKAGNVAMILHVPADEAAPVAAAVAPPPAPAEDGGSPLGFDFDKLPDAADPSDGAQPPTEIEADAPSYLPMEIAARPVEVPPSRGRLIPMALAITACLLVVIVGLWALSRDNATDKNTPRISVEAYERAIDTAIDAIEAGEYAAARTSLASVADAIPERRTASVIARVADTWEGAAGDFSTMKWDEIEDLMGEVLDWMPTSKARAFANRNLRWARLEQENEAVAAECDRLIREDKPEAAIEAFARMPADSVYRSKLAPQINAARDRVRNRYLTRAEGHVANGEWDLAIAEYGNARQFAEDNDETIRAGISRCRRARETETELARARELFEDGRYDAALRIAEDVDEESPLHERADGLREEILAAKELRQVREYYRMQQGQLALKVISESPRRRMLATIGEQISSVVTAWERGQAALQAKKYDEAAEHWQEILDLEPDEDNNYRKEAQRLLDTWGPGKIAESLYDEAMEKIRDGHFREARKKFKEAMALIDDGNELAEKMQEQTDHLELRGHRAYNQAINTTDPDEKRRLLEQTLELLSAEDIFYQWAQEQLNGLDPSKDEAAE